MDDLPGSALDDMLGGCCREGSSHWPRMRGGDAGPACLRSEIISTGKSSTRAFVSSSREGRKKEAEQQKKK